MRDDIFSDIGIPASVRFDRIQVSNILDANYIGIEGVLSEWAPFLKNSRTAVIVGYFMNWVSMQKDGRALSAEPKVMKKLLHRLMEEGKVREICRIFLLKHRPLIFIYLVSAEESDQE
jgi:hypothetical protein